MIRNMFGGTKCRTIDKVDIFGDSSGVALYQLDGNANDTGGQYHGTETAVTYGGGTYGRGGVFNGSSSRIDTTLALSNSAYSISAWINPNVSTAEHAIAGNTYTGLDRGFFLRKKSTDKKLSFVLCSGTNTYIYSSTSSLTELSLSNVVVTWDGTTVAGGIKLYINGTLDSSHTASVSAASIGTWARNISIGVEPASTSYYFWNGSIDQVRIFNRAITATEVATLYAECSPTSIVDNANPFEDNSLKAMYQFNGNANDLTGVYNGTATNVTYSAGKFGDCAVFNGSSSKIYGVNIIQRNLNPSFSFWIKPTVLNTARVLFSTRTNSVSDGYDMYLSATNQLVFTHYTIANYATSTVSAITTTEWSHIVFVCRTGFVDVYVNGTLFQKLTTGTYVAATAPFANIGVDAFSGGINWFNGSIEQFRIFNKALTPMEVAALYTETTPMEEPLAYQVDPFKDGSGKALYRLEGNALDESGNYNGTATSVTYGNGISGRCGVFNGSSSYITTPYIVPSISTISMSAWIKTTSVGTRQAIMADWNGGNNNQCRLTLSLYDGSVFYIALGNGATSYFSTSLSVPANVYDGNFHHIAYTISGTTIKLYLDGTLLYTIISTVALGTAGTSPCYIGKLGTFAGYYFNGSIEQPRIFHKELTQTEVTTIYQAGA